MSLTILLMNFDLSKIISLYITLGIEKEWPLGVHICVGMFGVLKIHILGEYNYDSKRHFWFPKEPLDEPFLKCPIMLFQI